MIPTITFKGKYEPPERPPKPEKVGTVEYSLPSVFWNAHEALGLPAGELLHRNATNTVRVKLDAEAFNVLLDSARFAIRNDGLPRNLRSSAQRTINQLLSHKRARPVDAEACK